jgi:hypothetical protein
MNDGEFYDLAIHTDVTEIANLRDHTPGQVLVKMAALETGRLAERVGTVVSIRFTKDLGLEMVTPIGTYSFVLDSDGEHLVVEQVR